MDKITLLNELKNINYKMGRHSGLWENCYDRETLAINTYEYMEAKARRYGIETKDNIKDYFFESDWQYHQTYGVEYAYDEIAYELYEKLNKKIMEMIL